MKLQKSDIEQFQQRLLTWYDREFRNLPWRRTSDPYAIWVSEIMLQQTQVKKVVPYFERFMLVLPTIEALAGADLDAVLKLWEGLGYYARARNLHKAAGVIVEKYDGVFPASMEKIRSLPGIGAYTAAAIASIAFGLPVPVVDGNVDRVICRLEKVAVSPKTAEGKKIVGETAEKLFLRERAGDFNQAMMELGAMICTPRSPKCDCCPVVAFCAAAAGQTMEDFPVKRAAKARPHYTIAIGVVRQNGRLLIDKRKKDGMLGGLWEFPGGKLKEGETAEQAVVRELKEELDIDVKVEEYIGTIEHQYSHFTITLHAYYCELIAGTPRAVECENWRWIRREELNDFAFPRANGKIIDILMKGSQET